MAIITNKKITQEFRISNTTVLNWIEAALEKKNNLILEKVGKKYKITDNGHNRAELDKLRDQALVYRNKITTKVLKPVAEFYTYFSYEQIIELIHSIKLNREIPLKFTYLKEGAEHWDKFTKLAKASSSYSTNAKIPELLNKILPILEKRVSKYEKVNILDVGTGNSELMVNIALKFSKLGKLGKYIGIDISKEMLEISQKTIQDLNLNISYIPYVCDYENTSFQTIAFDVSDENEINLLFLIGDTFGNIHNQNLILDSFRNCLADSDLLIMNNKVHKLEHINQFEPVSKLNPHIWLARMLGISPEKDLQQNRYDEKTGRRTSSLKMDQDYIVEFELPKKTVKVDLFKGEEIIFWWHKMSTKYEIFDSLENSGFELLEMTTTQDSSHVLAVAKPKNYQ